MTLIPLSRQIDTVLVATFSSLSFPAELAQSILSARPDLGDRQCNAAIRLAKMLDRDAMEVAEEIAAALSQYRAFSAVTVAKPGFVNMRLSDTFVAELAVQQGTDPDLGNVHAEVPPAHMIGACRWAC